MNPEAQAFVACYKAILALAKLLLVRQNEEDKRAGREDEWPAQQAWSDMVSSSHSIFLRRARAEAGIDHQWFAEQVRKHGEVIEELYEAAARPAS